MLPQGRCADGAGGGGGDSVRGATSPLFSFPVHPPLIPPSAAALRRRPPAWLHVICAGSGPRLRVSIQIPCSALPHEPLCSAGEPADPELGSRIATGLCALVEGLLSTAEKVGPAPFR